MIQNSTVSGKRKKMSWWGMREVNSVMLHAVNRQNNHKDTKNVCFIDVAIWLMFYDNTTVEERHVLLQPRQTTKANYVAMPIMYHHNHWCILWYNVKTGECMYYDSLPKLMDKSYVDFAEKIIGIAIKKKITLHIKHEQAYKQNDNISCGPATCLFFEQCMRNEPKTFTQNYLNEYRKTMELWLSQNKKTVDEQESISLASVCDISEDWMAHIPPDNEPSITIGQHRALNQIELCQTNLDIENTNTDSDDWVNVENKKKKNPRMNNLHNYKNKDDVAKTIEDKYKKRKPTERQMESDEIKHKKIKQDSERKKSNLKNETNEIKQKRLKQDSLRKKLNRKDEINEKKQKRLKQDSERKKINRKYETNETKQKRLKETSERMKIIRNKESETDEKKQKRLKQDSERKKINRKYETNETKQKRLKETSERMKINRKNETNEIKQKRLKQDSLRKELNRKDETNEIKHKRLKETSERMKIIRNKESETEREEKLQKAKQTKQQKKNPKQTGHNAARLHRTENTLKLDELQHKLSDMNEICLCCGASHWIEEKSEGSSKTKPKFRQCCQNGAVQIGNLPDPPSLLKELTSGINAKSQKFRSSSRQYNQALAFTSTGVHIEKAKPGIPYFKISGQWHHLIGNWDNNIGDVPKFGQLYTMDSLEDQSKHRHNIMPDLDVTLLEELQSMLKFDANNPFIDLYTQAKNKMNSENSLAVKICLRAEQSGLNKHTYNKPNANDVGALIPESESDGINKRDILIWKNKDKGLRRISEAHACYDPLHYVLLFPSGTFGWSVGLKKLLKPTDKTEDSDDEETTQKTKKKDVTISMREFYAARLHIRPSTKEDIGAGSYIFGSGRIFLQFVVDMCVKYESSRLFWIRNNQKTLRAEMYSGLMDALNTTEDYLSSNDVGHRVVLPSNYPGSPRQMHQLYQDSMAIVRKFGPPDLFITVTTNPNWPEIKKNLLIGQKPYERPDIVCRVFALKLRAIFHDLFTSHILGRVTAHVHMVEWQKRGLPHAHILITFDSKDKLKAPEDVDRLIRADIPDPEKENMLYNIVSDFNMHGPCGSKNPDAPCMIDGQCRFNYPKSYSDSTTMTQGSPIYKRPKNGQTVTVKRGCVLHKLTNQDVAPYNMYLSLRYNCHINVEAFGAVSAVKYLYKYVYKGGDRAIITLKSTNEEKSSQDRSEKNSKLDCKDEILNYVNSRYIGSTEAIWRLFEYKFHDEYPSVYRLPIHLENNQYVHFADNCNIKQIVDNGAPTTALLAWFHANAYSYTVGSKKAYIDGRTLTYLDYCEKFTFNGRSWQPRTSKKRPPIGRMRTVQPHHKEEYFLRLILCNRPGLTSYKDARTVNGETFDTYHETAVSLGLANNSNEWVLCMKDAAHFKSGAQLRALFASIIEFCEIIDCGQLWDEFKNELSEDLLFERRKLLPQTTEDAMYGDALNLINQHLSGYGRSLKDYKNMPSNIVSNEEIQCVTISNNYVDIESTIFSLNLEQKLIFDKVIQAVENETPKTIFIDALGGCGKTFVINGIIDYLRFHQHIVISVASSGVAALLLHNGRTAHSQLKIPITNLTTESRCAISAQSELADLLKNAKLIVWDEVSMCNRLTMTCVDETLKSVRNNNNMFGGLVVLFSGDFRQTLPVVPRASADEIIGMTLKFWDKWPAIEKTSLKINMRIETQTDVIHHLKLSEFADFLQHLGENTVEKIEVEDRQHPYVLLRKEWVVKTPEELIKFVFPDLHKAESEKCAILAPKNEQVFELNETILELYRKNEIMVKEYLSTDTIAEEENTTNYPVEFLNTINMGGLPPHRLRLCVGVPIMLLRNLNPKAGLVNGTRLSITELKEHVIQGRIINGPNEGSCVCIPRIVMTPSDTKFPFKLLRRQFPVQLSWAMTINKSQGQTLKRAGLHLETPCFSHGQLYVGCSRVGNPDHLKVYLGSKERGDITPMCSTPNIVYEEVLH